MRAAFNHYHRKATLTHGTDTTTYQEFFDPVPYAGSLTPLGAQRKHGVKRRMLIENEPALLSIIAANIVLANQTVNDDLDSATTTISADSCTPNGSTTLTHTTCYSANNTHGTTSRRPAAQTHGHLPPRSRLIHMQPTASWPHTADGDRVKAPACTGTPQLRART